MQRGDVRAVENPISAIFDLADDVSGRLPRIRQVVKYTRIFVGFWLVVDFLALVVLGMGGVPSFLILVLLSAVTLLYLARRWTEHAMVRAVVTALAIAGTVFVGLILTLTSLFLGPVFLVLYFLGLVILELLADLRRFLAYYGLRHRVIQSVRSEDPIVRVPAGTDMVQRLLSYLSARNPRVRAQAARPGSLLCPALLRGASGMSYQFEAFLGTRSSSLWPLLGGGAPGYSLFVKSFAHPPTRSDLEALKRAAEDVCAATRSPPSRVIAVWKAGVSEALDPAAYGYVTSEVVTFVHRGSTFRCSLEVITESPDGTYDFIPVISDGAYGASG